MPAPTEIEQAFQIGREQGRKESGAHPDNFYSQPAPRVAIDPMLFLSPGNPNINAGPLSTPMDAFDPEPQLGPTKEGAPSWGPEKMPSNLKGNEETVADTIFSLPDQLTNPESHFWAIPRNIGEGLVQRSQEFGQRVGDEGLFPAIGTTADDIVQTNADFVAPGLRNLSDWFLGPPAEGQEVGEDFGIQAPPYGGGTPGASGSGGASVSGSASGREAADSAFSRDVTLPSPADEIISQDDVPSLSRDKLDDFLASLEDTGPGEFERDDLDTSRLLNSMGRALAEAGRAPTFGQALLALGTGGTGARAAHTEEQRQLAREHAMRQNEFQRMLAEQAFSGEQMLNESARGALNTELTRDRLEAAQEQRRNKVMNSLGGVEVQGDYLIVNTPEQNDDGTMTVKTSIQNIGDKAGSAQAKIWTGQGLTDMELPEVGGVEMQKRLAQVQSPQHRMDMAVSGMFAIDSAPLSRIQPVRYRATDKEGNPVIKEMSGKRYFEEVVERDVMNKIAMEIGLDADASESQIRTRLNSMDADPEVFIEDRMLTGIMEHMAANPSFRQSAWQAVGFLDSGNE